MLWLKLAPLNLRPRTKVNRFLNNHALQSRISEKNQPWVQDLGKGCRVDLGSLLGGSCVIIGRVISPLVWVISIAVLLITLLTTTDEPPSKDY